jgi:hypothetical protein
VVSLPVVVFRSPTNLEGRYLRSKMKNINDVLKQKEIEYMQLQKDIEALRVAARLLAEDDNSAFAKAAQAAASPPMGAMRPSGVSGDSSYAPVWDAAPKKFP